MKTIKYPEYGKLLSKKERIEQALRELVRRKILSHGVKFDGQNVWEVSFPSSIKYKGISLLDFSIRDVSFSHCENQNDDMRAIIDAVDISIRLVAAETTTKLRNLYNKIEI